MHLHLVIVALIALAATPGVAAIPHHHCSSSEIVLFACPTKSFRTASVCGKSASATANGYLQYRYGRPGRVEVEVPTYSNAQPVRALIYTNPLGDREGYIRFHQGRYSYTVFHFSSRATTRPKDGSAPGWNNWNGVLVERAGQTISVVKCREGGGFETSLERWPSVALDDAALDPPILKKLQEQVIK